MIIDLSKINKNSNISNALVITFMIRVTNERIIVDCLIKLYGSNNIFSSYF